MDDAAVAGAGVESAKEVCEVIAAGVKARPPQAPDNRHSGTHLVS